MPGRWGGGPVKWWHGEFRGCGYRITIPRQTILQVLDESKEHLSAEDIYLKVHSIYPAIGLTTVYRTLDLLINMGLIFKFDFGDGRARYELARGTKEPSHHQDEKHAKRRWNWTERIRSHDRKSSRILRWLFCTRIYEPL